MYTWCIVWYRWSLVTPYPESDRSDQCSSGFIIPPTTRRGSSIRRGSSNRRSSTRRGASKLKPGYIQRIITPRQQSKIWTNKRSSL